MKWACRIFLVLYLIALGLFAVATFSLFGQERDPLGFVFLLPLGLPWNLAADLFGSLSGLFAAIAPAINLALLHAFRMRGVR